MDYVISLVYVVSAVFFILGLKKLGSPVTARSGNLLSGVGMLSAILVTFFDSQVLSLSMVLGGVVIGTVVGIGAARWVAMTAMPEMVAILNGFGGLSSLLVGMGSWWAFDDEWMGGAVVTVALSVLIGGMTFSGSMVAWGKLRGFVSGKPVVFFGQKGVNAVLLLAGVLCVLGVVIFPQWSEMGIWGVIGVSLFLGMLMVLPIGGADMPVVISLLNSYSGVAACAAGFAISNTLLIVAGALVGASGLILTSLMCKAMNRSLGNVLFSGFGSGGGVRSVIEGEVKSISASDTYYVLEAASRVVIVPGYGLAVAQAQHVVQELGALLERNGCEVQYAIHPVAGRMPGHMNVLLAEADIAYDQLIEMDDINPIMQMVDVCLVVGANDVVNPAAIEDEDSPLYGMPIIRADVAKTTIVFKRSMSAGFAGIDNPLFYRSNTRLLFGDAKQSLQQLVSEFKDT